MSKREAEQRRVDMNARGAFVSSGGVNSWVGEEEEEEEKR
jgi:hypothetical protein